MNIPGDLPKLLASEEAKILQGIFNDYIGPYIRRKFLGQIAPVDMTDAEAEKKAAEDFPPAAGDDYNMNDFK